MHGRSLANKKGGMYEFCGQNNGFEENSGRRGENHNW